MLRPKTKMGIASRISVITIIVIALMSMFGAAQAQAHHNAWRWKGPVTATWYGPGFYGNQFACRGAGRYHYRVRGVAVNSSFLPCGAKVTMRYKGRIIRVKVIDRCPGCDLSYHPFDLTQQSMYDLCICHYTLHRVYWFRGWYA